MALGLRFNILGIDRASGPLNNVGDAAGRTGGALKGIGKAAAVGLAGAGVAATVFGNSAVNAFAAVEDATGAAGVQFGKALPQIQTFADQAFSSFGLSQRAALEAANTFGTLGKAAGLQGAPLAKFSTDFAGLAGDLASFKGTSTEQAIEAVGAALRGEAEPIRAYGVLLDDASLRQEALRQGLIKTTKDALTPQQKVLATQALLYKQTADAQGDFARTSDSTANTQKRLQAATENAKVALGEKLAPAFTAARAAVLKLIQGSTKLIDFLGKKLGPPIKTLVAGFKGLGTASGETGSFLNKLGLGFRALILAFKDGDVTSGGLVGTFEKVGVTLRKVFDFVKAEVIPRIVDFYKVMFTQVLPTVVRLEVALAKKLGPILRQIGAFLAGQVVPVFRSLWAAIQKQLIPAFQGLVVRIKDNKDLFITIGKVIGVVVAVVVVVGAKIAQFLIPILARLIQFSVAVIGKIIGIVAAFVRFATKIGQVGVAIFNFVRNAVSKFSEFLGKVREFLQPVIDKVGGVGGKVSDLGTKIATFVRNAVSGFQGFAEKVGAALGPIIRTVQTLIDGIQRVLNLIPGLPGQGGGTAVGGSIPFPRGGPAPAAPSAPRRGGGPSADIRAGGPVANLRANDPLLAEMRLQTQAILTLAGTPRQASSNARTRLAGVAR